MAGGLQRDELDGVPAEDALERLDVEPVGVGGDADHAGARGLERADHPDERRRLDARDVSLAQHRPRDQVDRLAGAGRDHDLVAVGGEPVLLAELTEPLAQERQALDVGVAEGAAPLGREHGRRRGGEVGCRQRIERRAARPRA